VQRGYRRPRKVLHDPLHALVAGHHVLQVQCRARVRASAYEPEELMVEGDESTSEVRD
jgi:hypothetical protein